MALKIEKWTTQTLLRAINYGNSPLEFSSHLTADSSRKGKTFTLAPKSEQFIRVGDLLPVTDDELSTLSANDISLRANNTGTEPTQFNLLDHGPYKSKINTLHYDSPHQRMLDACHEAFEAMDYYTMKQFIDQPVPEQWKGNAVFYSAVHYYRGQFCKVFVNAPEADKAFEIAWKDYPNERYAFCFEWAAGLLGYLVYAGATDSDKGRAMEKAIEVLNRMEQHLPGSAYDKYYRMGASCVRAFVQCYFGEEDSALSEFDDFDFEPLSPEQFIDPQLNYFFRFVAYGFWAALEMKNSTLLRDLSSIISTGFPDMLYEPSAVHCFRRAFGNASEKGRKELDAEVYNLQQTAHLYAPEMANLRAFVEALNRKDDEALQEFIPFVE